MQTTPKATRDEIKSRITITGDRAVRLAIRGATIYCLNPQLGWIRGDDHMKARAARMLAMGSVGTWVYGTEAS